jgi:hypothetical protein
MLERRSFLISCGCIVAGLAAAEAGTPDVPAMVLPPRPSETSEAPGVALRVQGWDAPEPAEGAGGQIWISIDRSWRAAWR